MGPKPCLDTSGRETCLLLNEYVLTRERALLSGGGASEHIKDMLKGRWISVAFLWSSVPHVRAFIWNGNEIKVVDSFSLQSEMEGLDRNLWISSVESTSPPAGGEGQSHCRRPHSILDCLIWIDTAVLGSLLKLDG